MLRRVGGRALKAVQKSARNSGSAVGSRAFLTGIGKGGSRAPYVARQLRLCGFGPVDFGEQAAVIDDLQARPIARLRSSSNHSASFGFARTSPTPHLPSPIVRVRGRARVK